MATDGANATSHNTPTSDQASPSWEGDRMFNIYIYDYCMKRGFHKTATELLMEANIPPQSHPPINAKQGLLFEWWSVFWVLFTAKSSGQGPEDAMMYTQHQAASQTANQKANRTAPGHQRYTNGVRPPTQNGPQPNGAGPQVSQPPPVSMPNGAPSAGPFPGNMAHTNGVPGTSAGPPGGVPPPQGNGPQLGHGQRVGPPQQRGVNGAQFQSPTMAHSPPNAQGGPQQNAPMGGGLGPVGTNPPLTQMNQRGNMLPPNGPTGPMGNPQHTPQPAYQQLVGRSPSNPGSPGSAIIARSPSMAHRQPLDMLNAEINRMPPPLLNKLKQEMGLADKDVNAFSMDEKQQLVNQFRRINMKPPNMPGPGPSAGPSGQPGPSPLQHPAGLRTPQMQPNAPQQGQPPHQQQQGQNQQQRGAKRNSTSPGQEAEQLPRNESSPPDRKRVRRSPGGEQVHQQQQQQQPQQQQLPPPMTPMYPPQSGAPPMQHMQQNGMMRNPMQPYPGPPMGGMNNPMMGHGLGAPQMNPMNATMMGGPPPGAGMNNAQIHQYRQQMSALHKGPAHMQQMHPGGNIASPSASGVQQGDDQQRQGMQYMTGGMPPGNRMAQNKPMGMLPPPSPGMNPKQPGGPMKSEGSDSSIPNGHLDRSPQNAAAGHSQQQQQQQHHHHPQHPQQGQTPQGGPPPSGTPAPPTPTASSMTAPSPSAILATSTPSMSHPPPPPPPSVPSDGLDPTNFGPIDFGPGGLTDFEGSLDPSIFGGAETSLNFERDFAAWFDPENANGA